LLVGGQAGHGLLRGVHAAMLRSGLRACASSRAAGGRVSLVSRCVRGERSLGNEPGAGRGIGFKDRARCEARAARGRGKRESRSHTCGLPEFSHLCGGCCCCSSGGDSRSPLLNHGAAPCPVSRANKATATKECRDSPCALSGAEKIALSSGVTFAQCVDNVMRRVSLFSVSICPSAARES
jgi:hypothetical protein